MAIEINLPKSDPAHDQMTANRGGFIQSTLNALGGSVQPASHQNSLFDNMMGFLPHRLVPTDIAHNGGNSH